MVNIVPENATDLFLSLERCFRYCFNGVAEGRELVWRILVELGT
jgi:hypothetical protein